MRRYLFKNPNWFSWPYHEALWKVDTSEKILYLTFDDGPDPEITPLVLDLLLPYHAKATFFLIGELMEGQEDLVKSILSEGHLIGNHSMHHLSGWKLSVDEMLQEVNDCQSLLPDQNTLKFYRPPYGNIRFSQLRKLKSDGFQVVMWSFLSGDFDEHLDVKESIRKMKTAGPGDIMVFHDSKKAFKNLSQILPEVLQHFSTLGFQFKTLSTC